jgi:uncharacterized protein (DUF433 family)
MTVAATTYEHVALDDQGVPVIAGANTKVVEVVTLVQAHGLSAEEICYQLPHLTMGQVHSALAYYWDHQKEIDRDIRRREEYAERMRREMGQPPIVDKLKRQGLL